MVREYRVAALRDRIEAPGIAVVIRGLLGKRRVDHLVHERPVVGILEQGVDQDGRKYYKIYFEKEF